MHKNKMNKQDFNQPLVTVLMTAYNAEKFIDKAIASIIYQTYKNLEIIIVDDGSTDNTPKIIEYFKNLDQRIRVIRLKKNKGPSLASNIGLKIAKGEYIARLDADDIALPDRIEKQVKFLLKNPEVAVVGGQCILINEKDRVIGEKKFPLRHNEIYKALFNINPIQHPSCLINRKLLPNEIVYHKNHYVLAHDLELIFELRQFGKLANLDEKVIYYRQYPNSLSLRNPKETFKATFAVRQKALKKYGYQPTLKGYFVHYCQTIVVSILPGQTIYPIFKLIRFKNEGGLKEIIPRFWASTQKQVDEMALELQNLLNDFAQIIRFNLQRP